MSSLLKKAQQIGGEVVAVALSAAKFWAIWVLLLLKWPFLLAGFGLLQLLQYYFILNKNQYRQGFEACNSPPEKWKAVTFQLQPSYKIPVTEM